MNTDIYLSLEDRIMASVTRRGRGCVFFGEDFLSLGSPAAVRQALSRLARAETIRRVGMGLYHYPVINEKLGGELPPSMDTVARAIARRTGTRIVATGAQAANLLGLSTQVPAKPIYLTDGSSRSVAIGNYSIVFRHAGPRRMGVKNDISVLVFEALRYIGRANVTDQVAARLRRTLPAEAKAKLRRDLHRASIWMRPIVKRITEQ
ncbi:MAG: hypothetical protein CO113_03380 [Elusimicrobia bacterium CG_4_9_14_3_um_filter_62_55]|nr:MAG: hypothetical protein COR54_10835 [Elusimicrobia bacterium CG22_combo_CG10-13_8_21_14_all_63_91]PJA11816.1 MAG: hypothetical protein COX66_18850 [Elusimicrobia bacterium CG_4_10_14_0_2_um_filter_63_34]PJB26476.1 MAG: hypothetical protein CO113_03380 [Elusimicrobia bacterium CG_4_9_14_3_um_filter_62_55]